jgi:membrane-associated protein
MPWDVDAIIQAVGYPGLFFCIFAETGLLIGFFLPGDTLLIAAGVLAQRGQLDIALVILVTAIGAIVGDATGYVIGRKSGPLLFQKDEGRFFPKKRLLQGKRFFDKHGGKTIFIARFIGYVRTAAPTVAGASEMPAMTFFAYNILGGLTWVFSLALAAYYLGSAVQNIERGAVFLFGGAFLLAMIPVSWELYRKWQKKHGKTVRGEKQLDRLKRYLIGDDETLADSQRDDAQQQTGHTKDQRRREDALSKHA